MNNSPLGRIAGSDQSYRVPAGETFVGNMASVLILENETTVSVLTESTIDRDPDSGTYRQRITVDVLAEQGLDALPINNPAILVPRRGYFTSIQVDKPAMAYLLLSNDQKIDQ